MSSPNTPLTSTISGQALRWSPPGLWSSRAPAGSNHADDPSNSDSRYTQSTVLPGPISVLTAADRVHHSSSAFSPPLVCQILAGDRELLPASMLSLTEGVLGHHWLRHHL